MQRMAQFCPVFPAHCPFGEACYTCPARVQAKLKINQPGDVYEQEADRIAEQVMRTPEPVPDGVSAGPPTVQRKCAACASGQGLCPKCAEEEALQRKPLAASITPIVQRQSEPLEEAEKEETLRAKEMPGGAAEVGPGLSARINALRGGGQPLSQSERDFFEPRFGYDFSRVRIHTGAQAAEAARAVHARAFTFGRDIAFGSGEYAPETSGGRHLLAHELSHTLEQGAESRLSRACERELAAIPIPSRDSFFTGQALVNLGTVPVTPDISVSPLAGTFHVKLHVPRRLQRIISPSLLSEATLTMDISARLTSEGTQGVAARYAGNKLCVFITFHRQGGDGSGSGNESENWYADLHLLPGSAFQAPLHLGAGSLLQPARPIPFGTGVARVTFALTEELTTSVGPFHISSTDELLATWSGILDQVRDILNIRIANIQVPVDLRAHTSLTVPVPLPGEGASVIPVHVLGDIRLETHLSTTEEGFTLRLSGGGRGTALAGLVSLELSGRGRLRGPIPSSVRLGDLTSDFLQEQLRASRGGGEITARLRAFGIPGRVDADFRLLEGRVVGRGTFISPIGLGKGTFSYDLREGLSSSLGMVGLTRLVLAPAEERLRTGPAPFELGTSVAGLGVTGLRITPSTTQALSVGVGPQFITTPAGRRQVGVFAGFHYQIDY